MNRERLLTVSGLLEVDVGVTERAAGHHVPAHPNGQNGPGRAELLVKHGLGDILVQITHIKGGHRVTWSARVHLSSVRQKSNLPKHLETLTSLVMATHELQSPRFKYLSKTL